MGAHKNAPVQTTTPDETEAQFYEALQQGDIDKLMANRQWTGHVLVQKRPIISWSRLSVFSTGASIIAVIALKAYRLRFAKGGTKAGNEVVVS